jgi:predicted aminopeptidase
VGQTKILLARQSIEGLLADPATDSDLRDKLVLVREAREFAGELGLAFGNQYTSYVAWPDDRMITSIVATRPFEIEAAGFRFPIIGEVPYKGFFDRDRAERAAEKLRAEGMDVCIGAVTAYSTLGWFDDPLTSPMLKAHPDSLVETVIHELVHATVFLKSQPDFNEGVANFIGEEATVLFFEQSDRSPPPGRNPRDRIDDGRVIDRAMMKIRQNVDDLYSQSPS